MSDIVSFFVFFLPAFSVAVLCDIVTVLNIMLIAIFTLLTSRATD